jgi:RNA polymerase sigma-70 factor (ECF subfamily)
LEQIAPIREIKSGQAFVFVDIVNRWQGMIYNTALSIVQNAQDAEDITQEVFVQLHKSVETFREEALLSTWLYRVTINKALDHEKRKKAQKRGGLLRSFFYKPGDSLDFNHPGVQVENKEKAAVLFRAINELPASQRIAFILHKMEGRSYQEISEILETSYMAVESLLARAKRNLQKILRSWYETNMK